MSVINAAMIQKDGLATLARRFDTSLANVHEYLKENASLIFALAAVALCAYGFEFFQLNLTVDEELHAEYLGPTRGWVSQGRWGMYLIKFGPYSDAQKMLICGSKRSRSHLHDKSFCRP